MERCFEILFRWLVDITVAFSIVFLAIFAVANASHRVGDHKKITIVAGLVPPQIDEKGDGREARIIKKGLSNLFDPSDVEFHVLPFSRHWYAYLSDDRYDAVATVPFGLDLGGYPSKVYVEYQNGVWFRSAAFPNGMGPYYLDTLKNHNVVAFAGASGIIPGLSHAARHFALYLERKNQIIHSLLFNDHVVDAVIADELIFPEYNKRLKQLGIKIDDADLTFSPVVCPTQYHLVFRRAIDRDYFDHSIQIMEQDGSLDSISKPYRNNSVHQDRQFPKRDC